MPLQQKIDRITDILRRDDGISGAMHYTEQISWILFLKFLDSYEEEKADAAYLDGKDYDFVMAEEYRWNLWACPKDEDGNLDVKNALTTDDLTGFVNDRLFPYLKGFKHDVLQDTKTFQYKIGSIFEYLDNRIANGNTLREVLDIIDTLDFQSQSELFEMGDVYERLLKGMGNDGGNSGEFYTPRPIIKAMVEGLQPEIGQTVYDGAAGTGGFLIEAFLHMQKKATKTDDNILLQESTFYGREKTPLAFTMCMMNMILHGMEKPNVAKENTLTINIRDIQEKDRHDIILANPPFGGKEKGQIQQNFPVKSNATELLFLQHFMKMLRVGGKAAIVVPEGVLFQTGNSFQSVKMELLENFNLHTILSLPAGIFLPYSGVKTNVIFFNRKGGTSEIWYYEVNLENKLTKNKPILNEHLEEFVRLYPLRSTTPNSWTVRANQVQDFDLSAKNPAKITEVEHLPPKEILSGIKANDEQIANLIFEIENILADEY
jgi:type I restriction enzyme M protein